MDQLAFDLLLYVHEPDTVAMLVRIEERIVQKSQPASEEGVLKCHVEEVIHGKVAAVEVEVMFGRMLTTVARAKASVNHWNALPLEVGDQLLIVAKPSDGGAWKAMSGNQVTSSTDPVVAGLRECYRIQSIEQGSAEHKRALRNGLVAANPLTRRYALEAISRHEVVAREVGCAMIVDCLKEETLDRHTLLRFADVLSSLPFFDEDQSADDVNQAVVVNLANIIDRLANPEDQVTCVRYLASCILASFDPEPLKDKKVRSALLNSIGPTPPKSVAATLTAMMHSQSLDDKAIAADLRSAW